MTHRPSKLDDLIYFRVTTSSSSNNSSSREPTDDLMHNDEQNFLRPGTARSLPTPYSSHQTEEAENGIEPDKASLTSNRFLNVTDYNGSRQQRNLSYPSIHSLPPPPPSPANPVRLINVASIKKSDEFVESEIEEDLRLPNTSLQRQQQNSIHHKPPQKETPPRVARKTSRLSTPVPPVSTPIGAIDTPGGNSSPVSPNNFILTSSGKSKLEFFLDYSRNPFTTKYEIIGKGRLLFINKLFDQLK